MIRYYASVSKQGRTQSIIRWNDEAGAVEFLNAKTKEWALDMELLRYIIDGDTSLRSLSEAEAQAEIRTLVEA